MDIVALASDT